MIVFLLPIAAALVALFAAYLLLRALFGAARLAPMLILFATIVAVVVWASR